MSPNWPRADPPTTEAEFERLLLELVRAAHKNNVDVEGGWLDRNPDPDLPDWGIEIHEVTKPKSI